MVELLTLPGFNKYPDTLNTADTGLKFSYIIEGSFMLEEDTYHAHVYFDQNSLGTARRVIDNLTEKFGIEAGAYHTKPVGPHPVGSCQVMVETKNLGTVMDWLAKNRKGLTIFFHANTGDVMKDHTQHTIWMGEMLPLNLEILRGFVNKSATTT